MIKGIRIFGKAVKIPVNQNLELNFYIDTKNEVRYTEIWRYENYTGLIHFANPIIKKGDEKP